MSTPLNTIRSWFETGDTPTQEQFWQTFSSFFHKDENIPNDKIEGLTELVEGFASAEALENHVDDEEAHNLLLAKRDAGNLNNENVELWRRKLNIVDVVIPQPVYNDIDETSAEDVLQRFSKVSAVDIAYRETSSDLDGNPLTTEMVDNVVYLKRNAKYYIDANFVLGREVYLENYGLIGDDTFRSISTVFPDVTLAQVQALDAGATLVNSADWYMLMYLNRYLPVNSTVILTGKYVIDREIVWRRSSMKWKGGVLRTSGKYPNDKSTSIRQIGEGLDCIAFKDGDGLTNNYTTQILNVTLEDFYIIGTMTADLRSGHGISVDIPNGDMVYCYFKNIRTYRSGKSGFRHISGHINDVYFDDCQYVINFDVGMWLDGKPSSQTNGLGFNRCSYSANGLVVRSGVLTGYDQTIDGLNYNKGGVSFGNISSTDFLACNMQSNNGFGLMLRENSSVAGLTITGYSEDHQLGGYVIACYEGSEVLLLTNSIANVKIFPEIPTEDFTSVFRSLDQMRKYIPSKAYKYVSQFPKDSWSENIVADAKNNVPEVGNPSETLVQSTSIDNGYKVRTVTRLNESVANFMDLVEYSKWDLLVKYFKKGDLISVAFDVKFDSIDPLDYANFSGLSFTFLSIDNSGGGVAQSKYKPTTDGTWTRCSYIYEVTGNEGLINFRPVIGHFTTFNGASVTYSIKKISVRVKTKVDLFIESSQNATTDLYGVVKQITTTIDSTASDVAGLKADYNELLQKMRDSGILKA